MFYLVTFISKAKNCTMLVFEVDSFDNVIVEECSENSFIYWKICYYFAQTIEILHVVYNIP